MPTAGDLSTPLLGRIDPDWPLETHLSRALFEAQRGRLTGALSVDEEGVTTRIHLADGEIVFVDRGRLAETLGRLLVDDGTIDREEYGLILEHMAETPEGQAVMRFGEVAIRLGMLSPGEIHGALNRQVERKLQRCLQLDEGFWHFEAGAPPDSRFPVRLEPALRVALREDPRAPRWAEHLWRKRLDTVRFERQPGALGERFGAAPVELRLLRAIEGRTLAAALESEILDRTQAGALLTALYLGGAMILEHLPSDRLDADETARLRAEHYRRREEKRTAMRARRAGEAADGLKAEMKRRVTAARTNSESKPRVEAERSFEEGRKLLARGAPRAALEPFERAARLLPEPEYVLHVAYCRHAIESDPVHRSIYETDLRAAALAALAENRKLGFAHFVQGRLFLDEGDLEGAERAFRIAARVDPGDVEAARYLRLVRRRLG